ncbi:cyclic nucleotide-binding domain-containing protein [Mesorhizobium sp. B2-1-8]|uniref:cyclic nucleotide-binding domain-containing protein n=1 Tax=Mesorhizobium sp. B2-1-8 TaxID=2589967 RepID=UPI001D1220BB|nr:cyclic nucleotide-binding domain-containing protein [Mesorhizobium sp. B2-1-8]UCI19059.1 cyclic nucleotide-binding domain-containing protein [Mesorhizobium sp. B2-1-8]
MTVRMAPTTTPAIVVDLMHTVLLSCNTILKEPSPAVAIASLDAAAIEVQLFFRVANLDQQGAARNEIFDLIYRHSKWACMLLAMPLSASVAATSPLSDEAAAPPRFTPIELIKSIPLFSALTDAEQESLAATTSVRTYRKGDIIARQGEILPSLMIVRTGVIVRRRGEDEASPREIGRLSPGDFFGENGLLAGIGEMSTLREMTHVAVYEIDQKSFASLLLERPEMAKDLAAILSSGTPTFGESSIPEH